MLAMYLAGYVLNCNDLPYCIIVDIAHLAADFMVLARA